MTPGPIYSPVFSRAGYKDQDVRQILGPLAQLAEELQVAILVIRHLTKAGDHPSIYPGGGSIGIIGAARSALLAFFGELILREITPKVVSSNKIDRRSEGAAPATINRELTLMKHSFSSAIKGWEWVNENHVKSVSMEKEPPARDRWLTYEGIITLFTIYSSLIVVRGRFRLSP